MGFDTIYKDRKEEGLSLKKEECADKLRKCTVTIARVLMDCTRKLAEYEVRPTHAQTQVALLSAPTMVYSVDIEVMTKRCVRQCD